jgi:hypothetical protein
VLFIMLWPAKTAGPEYDQAPAWLGPQLEFEDRLREVSLAAQEIQAEITAARSVPDVEAAGRDRPPEPNKVRINNTNWKPAPGQPKDPPCSFEGGGEPGRPPGWLRCTYVCGKYWVELNDVFGSSTTDCEKSVHLGRAKREAENWARVHDKER